MTAKTCQIDPGNGFDNDHIAANAEIDADKIRGRHFVTYAQADGADVASETKIVFTAVGRQYRIDAVTVIPVTAPTGGDKAFTVDVKNGDSGGAFATVLSAVVTINSSDSDRAADSGTVNTATVNSGDHLQVVVTASGSTGSQGQGVLVQIELTELN